MSLIDELRRIEHFPPSHLPTLQEISQVLGTLVAYVEHGDDLLKAVEDDTKALEHGETATAVDELLGGQADEPEQPAAPVTSPAAPLGLTPSQTSPPASGAAAAVPPAGAPDKDARIAELKRQLAEQSDEPDERDAEIAALEQQIATKRAVAQRTTASVTPGDSPKPPSSPPAEGGW